jgi:hypothetical protein
MKRNFHAPTDQASLPPDLAEEPSSTVGITRLAYLYYLGFDASVNNRIVAFLARLEFPLK